MSLRAGNVGPVAGFLATALAPTAPMTVGAAGHVDASVLLPGAKAGDSFLVNIVVEAAGAGLVASGATCAVDGTVTVRVENPSAAPIGPVTPHFNIFVLHPDALGN